MAHGHKSVLKSVIQRCSWKDCPAVIECSVKHNLSIIPKNRLENYHSGIPSPRVVQVWVKKKGVVNAKSLKYIGVF